MVPRRDNKQWEDACREVGIFDEDVYLAGKDFHEEKRAMGDRSHWPYRKLINWLREWREDT
jgi:hypothetical protein